MHQRPPWQRIDDRVAHTLAGVLCLIAVLLATGWALVLPMFLSPDEDSHYDYALTLHAAGRPVRHSENIVGRDTHPVVAYLMQATHARQQRLDTAVPAPPGYGTEAYFRAIDAGAPHVDTAAFRAGPIVPAPYISHLYPIGYYALASVAIGLGDLVHPGSVVAEFRFARFLSVALLVPTLVFTWLALCELGIGKRKALLLFACTALLPLTAWMAGYVQPDDLAGALLAPIYYVALRLRGRPGDPVLAPILGILLAALAATKQQYLLAALVPIAPMLAVRFRRLLSGAAARTFFWLFVPAFAALEVTSPLMAAAPGGGGVCQTALGGVVAAHKAGLAGVAALYARGIALTLQGAFFPGSASDSFWLAFTAYRNDTIVLGTEGVSNLVSMYISPVSVTIALLFAIRIVFVVPRLAAIARKRSWRSVARIVTSNVVVNVYLCYFAILCGFEMTIGGYIPVQGRYWLPVITGVWFCAIVIAPKALPRSWSGSLSAVLLTMILAFDVAASAFAFPTLHDRFYAPPKIVDAKKELLGDVVPRFEGATYLFNGAAVDLRDAAPVQRAVLRFDGATDVTTHAVPRPDVLCNMEQTLLQTGFETNVPVRRFAAGPHRVALLVETPWSHGLVDTGAHATFVVR